MDFEKLMLSSDITASHFMIDVLYIPVDILLKYFCSLFLHFTYSDNMAEVASSTSRSEDEAPLFRSFPPPPNDRLPSPPTSKSDEDIPPMFLRSFPPPPNERLPSPPIITISDTDGSGSAWENSFRRKNTTISGVTNEARKVLDSFLNRSFLGVQPPGPHAIAKDSRKLQCFKTSKQDDILIEKLQKKLIQLHNLSHTDPEGTSQQDESDYVYPQALHTPAKYASYACSVQSKKTELAVRPTEEAVELPEPVDSVEPTPSFKRKQNYQISIDDSASSSSTEDYELVDPNEFLARKKKSFFRRTTERLMQSFRRRKERQMAVELESPKEEAVPGEHTLGGKPKKKVKKGVPGYLPGIDEQNLSDSPFRSSSLKVRENLKITARPHTYLCKTGSGSGDNNGGGVVHSEGEMICKLRKSPLLWKHKGKGKEDVDHDSKGRLFDNLFRGIRKGSFKLKRKGSKGRIIVYIF